MKKGEEYMVKKSLFAPLMVFLALVSVSCLKEPVPGAVEERVAVGFVTSAAADGTKGAGETTTESLRAESFGVFAYYRDAGYAFDGVDDARRLMDNARMSFVESTLGGDRWVCDPTVWWPLGCSASFFAYAPYMDNAGAVLSLPNADGNPMLRGTYSVPSDVSVQKDFCLSAPVLDWTSAQGDVPVTFDHSLTKVLFYFNLDGSRYEGDAHAYRVKSLSLDGVVGTNKFTYGGTGGWSWDALPRNDLSNRTASYALSTAAGTLRDVNLPFAEDRSAQSGLDKFDCVNDNSEGVLYLLPQPMTTEASVTIQMGAYLYNAVSGEWEEDTRADIDPVTVSLPEVTVWQAGRTVCYSATLDMSFLLEIVFNVEVTAWGAEGHDVFIPAERLNTAEFSVSETDKVRFSTGNLQAVLSGAKLAESSYEAVSWRFAKNQWDRIGNASGNRSFAAGTVVDLFSWIGESGAYDSYGLCTDTSSDDSSGDPIHGTSRSEGLKTDWGSVPGVVSALGSGWRTLSIAEWNYLALERSSGATVNGVGDARFTLATIRSDVAAVRGCILFPDGVTVAAGEVNAWGEINEISSWATMCTAAQWAALEAKGCVFLPASGYRSGKTVSSQNSLCAYWTSSPRDVAGKLGQALAFRWNTTVGQYNRGRAFGLPVRLVRDVQGGVEPEPAPPVLPNYFWLEGVEAGSVTSTKNVEWSRDQQIWNSYVVGTSPAISLAAGQKVYFRETQAAWNQKHIKSSARYKVGGNIASLLVGDDFETQGSAGVANYTFCDFFNNDDNLTDASELVIPMLETYNSSFKSMFQGCDYLVYAPESLPATSLGPTCYRNMFRDCPRLTTTPVLADASMKPGEAGAYEYMFYNSPNVTSITCWVSTFVASSFSNWVGGVSGTGVFQKKASAAFTTGSGGIPSGWTVVSF